MEGILFGSQEIDLTFDLSDNSISSDEDLLPIDCYKTDPKPNASETTSAENCSKSDNSFIKRLNKISNNWKESEDKSDLKTNQISYYSECPLCKSLGPKSIHHIKHCANKRSVDPKQVIQLLNKCQKSDQNSINCQKSKSNPKQNKRINKLTDNYVISFGPQKRLQISINPKLISDKNSKFNPNKYQLSSLDPTERLRLFMSKINDQIVGNLIEKMDQTSDESLISINYLPNIWRLSSLDSDSDQYFVEGFEKYDSKS